MLSLINSNQMTPPIAPIGLDYVAGAARNAGLEVDILDLCLADHPDVMLSNYFSHHQPELVGISFRNVDDCFWPSGQSFLPNLTKWVNTIRELTDTPIVIGGIGFSIFAEQIVEHARADFGIRGDGERAIVALMNELQGTRQFDRVDGLIWQEHGKLRANPPSWPGNITLPTHRDAVDNIAYFRKGGQGSIETKRGCNRGCIYCADSVAKGTYARLRSPAEIADEIEQLLAQGVDVLHLCDAEFNIPMNHANAVCEELIRRSLGPRLRWYAYMAVLPFDDELARNMSRAGCVGINFTGDSAADAMLETYRQPHRRDDLARAVQLCRENKMAIMIDLLLGGPGETAQTITETIDFMKQIEPDCIGAALGVRVYPHTPFGHLLEAQDALENNPSIRRHYAGPVDFLKPTFYIASELGECPAALVRDLIAGDPRFFEPRDDLSDASTDHNYNDNNDLTQAIANGARGAYWDILRKK